MNSLQSYYRRLLWFLVILAIYFIHQSVNVSMSSLDASRSSTLIDFPSSIASIQEKPTFPQHAAYPPRVHVDAAPLYYKALLNRFLLGPYVSTNTTDTTRVPPHDMDAVILSAGPDPTVAVSVHNLFHLCGFRRFIFVVNDATMDCEVMFDMVPQHFPEKPHLCLDHYSFFNASEQAKLRDPSVYPNLHRGAPGKLSRGKKGKVQVPRMKWYLQQFSKFQIPQLVPNLSPQYLAIDGDLIFTRPFQFQLSSNSFVLPKTSKSPKHWRYFVDLIFDNEWNTTNVTTTDNSNFVVGWMVLDQEILQDLIQDINRLMPDPNGDVFPWNILNEGERIIHQTFYSEFYLYGRYALQHRKSNLYQPQKILEPARNPGNFQYTCSLTRHVYESAQANPKRAPFLLWEEHKHHAFDSCPDADGGSDRLTRLTQVGIWHDFHPPPWGGGNQFLLALRRGLESDPINLTVVGHNDEPSAKNPPIAKVQAFLANSITFKGKLTVWDQLKEKHQLALVHRVDGPYYSTRYGRSFVNLTVDGANSASVKVPEEDKKTKNLNRKYACATVFQSRWSLEANLKIGLSLRNPVLIPNTVDPAIFFPSNQSKLPLKDRKIRIVATSHSSNERKGFDTMLWLDQHLDQSRFDFYYMGGTPKGFQPRNMRVLSQVDSQGVGDFLRSGDIYLAPSRDEPASNAVLEALACGLPVLFQTGSSHGDLVGGGGLGFDTPNSNLLSQLDNLVVNYDKFVMQVTIPSISVVSNQYLAVLRWCFYMKHLMT